MMDPWRDDPIEDDYPARSGEIGVAAHIDRTEERDLGNDQGRHVAPPDNDGETVPGDEASRGATSGGR